MIRLPLFLAALATACLVAGLATVRIWRHFVQFVGYRIVHGWE
jgi:hypothetical protein